MFKIINSFTGALLQGGIPTLRGAARNRERLLRNFKSVGQCGAEIQHEDGSPLTPAERQTLETEE